MPNNDEYYMEEKEKKDLRSKKKKKKGVHSARTAAKLLEKRGERLRKMREEFLGD